MESKSRPCGCRYIRPDGAVSWYQVVACPGHSLNYVPRPAPPDDAT